MAALFRLRLVIRVPVLALRLSLAPPPRRRFAAALLVSPRRRFAAALL
jgi:hypothetical protein